MSHLIKKSISHRSYQMINHINQNTRVLLIAELLTKIFTLKIEIMLIISPLVIKNKTILMFELTNLIQKAHKDN
jgi:hypothetical protein